MKWWYKNTTTVAAAICTICIAALTIGILYCYSMLPFLMAEQSTPSVRHRRTKEHAREESNMVVVMCTNQPDDPRLGLLKESLLGAGFTPEECVVLVPEGGGFSWAKRLTEWKRFYGQCNPQTVVLSLDAFDVVALRDTRQEMLEKFQRSNYDVLFGCTTYCWPNECGVCKEKQDGDDEFLCAGTYMGYAGVLVRLLETHPWSDDVDDQCYFATLRKHGGLEHVLGLDTNAEMFQSETLRASLESSKKHGRVKNTKTGTEPCILHYDSSHLNYDELKHQVTNVLHVL